MADAENNIISCNFENLLQIKKEMRMLVMKTLKI